MRFPTRNLAIALAIFAGLLAGWPAQGAEAPTPSDQLKLDQPDPDSGPVARASSWLGKSVESATGEAIGQVTDLEVDLEEAHLGLVVVRPNGKAAASVFIPTEALAAHGDKLALKNSEVSLDKLPKLPAGIDPQHVTRLWASGVYAIFGVEPYWKEQQLTSTWSGESEYGKLYNPQRVRTISGQVESVDNVAPLAGMAVGTQLTITSSEGWSVVLVAPVSYLSRQDVAFRKGETVTVTGSEIKIGERPVLAAAKVTHGDNTLTLRDDQGKVLWAWNEQRDAYGFTLLTSIVNMPVQNRKGDELGRVEDLAVSVKNASIPYAAVACSCFPKTAGKLFPIPLGSFVVPQGAKAWTLELPEEVLANTPTFEKGHWPESIDRGWIEYVHVRYGRSSRGGVRSTPQDAATSTSNPK